MFLSEYLLHIIMKKRLMIILSLFVLVACGSSELVKYQCTDGSIVEHMDTCPSLSTGYIPETTPSEDESKNSFCGNGICESNEDCFCSDCEGEKAQCPTGQSCLYRPKLGIALCAMTEDDEQAENIIVEETIIDGDYPTEMDGGDLGKKKVLLNSGSSDQKIDLLFIPQRIQDMSKIPEIVNELLNNPVRDSAATGLFSIAPFKGNINRFNVAYVDKNLDEDYFDCTLEKPEAGKPTFALRHGCDYKKISERYSKFNPDYIVVLFDLPSGYQSTGGVVQRLDIDSPDKVNTFVHEWGHQFGGLADAYPYTGSPSFHCGTAQDTSCFEEYNQALEFYPNLDVLGCPKWCESYDLDKLIEINKICTKITNQQECEKFNLGGICTWFETKHPYLNSHCIKVQTFQDIGINCLEDTKCWMGGDYSPLAFNPGDGIMQDRQGKFSKPSLDHLTSILDCCYPRKNTAKCKQFRNSLLNVPDKVNYHLSVAFSKIVSCS
jgi:hypothetical protein